MRQVGRSGSSKIQRLRAFSWGPFDWLLKRRSRFARKSFCPRKSGRFPPRLHFARCFATKVIKIPGDSPHGPGKLSITLETPFIGSFARIAVIDPHGRPVTLLPLRCSRALECRSKDSYAWNWCIYRLTKFWLATVLSDPLWTAVCK